MGSKNTPMILMTVTLVCAIIPAAVGAMLPPSVFAQQEETSLGDNKEDLAGGIVSDILDGYGYEDEKWDNDSDVEDEFNQDATVTATIGPNEGEDVNEDNVGESGYDISNLDDANAAAPNTTPIYVEESEEESSTATSSSPDGAQQSLSIKFAGEPSLTLNQPFDERGLATSSSITASGTVIVTGSGVTMTLTSDTNVFSICEDDETGELSNTQNVQSTISSDPVTIKPGRQSFEITTDPITEPIGDGGCEEGQTEILNFVQFIEPVLTIQTEGGNTMTHTFPSVP
ncbi:MAG TPA: hypothetical protein VN239_08970 [Nitrososphaera sp.]|jgi:hypothetical protein|nr:hypothetical protein [Nitrososphaera sp.]